VYRFDFLDPTFVRHVADSNVDVRFSCRLLILKLQTNCDFTFFCFEEGGVHVVKLVSTIILNFNLNLKFPVAFILWLTLRFLIPSNSSFGLGR
jgi:hypothetical protein